MRRLLLVLGFGFGAMAACDTNYEITILPHIDDGGFRGFQCSDDAGPLANRINGTAVIVLEVLDFGKDVLTCRFSSVFDYCTQHGCPVIARTCNSVSLKVFSLTQAIQSSFAQLREQDAGISNLPTDRSLMVRLVATVEDPTVVCPGKGVYPTLDTQALVGCAYGCPARLDANGVLDVELDSISQNNCELEVDTCATIETLGPK